MAGLRPPGWQRCSKQHTADSELTENTWWKRHWPEFGSGTVIYSSCDFLLFIFGETEKKHSTGDSTHITLTTHTHAHIHSDNTFTSLNMTYNRPPPNQPWSRTAALHKVPSSLQVQIPKRRKSSLFEDLRWQRRAVKWGAVPFFERGQQSR